MSDKDEEEREQQHHQRWADAPSLDEQIVRFGYPLSHFREHRAVEHNRVGGKSQRDMFTVAGFSFVNVLDSKAPLDITLSECINDFVRESVQTLNLTRKNVTMVLHHDGLREVNKTLFININRTTNPGENLLGFFEKFAQSNKNFGMQEPMSFDFFINS